MLCEIYTYASYIYPKNAGSLNSSASAAPYTASPYEVLGSTIELNRFSTSFWLYPSLLPLLFHSVHRPRQSYRKIPKISTGAYIFQRPFLRGLFLEGLIFGGAYLGREICISKSTGLALQLGVNLPFLLCFTLYSRAIFQVQASWGLYLAGDLTEGFLRYRFGGLIFGGAYFRNFTFFSWKSICSYSYAN